MIAPVPVHCFSITFFKLTIKIKIKHACYVLGFHCLLIAILIEMKYKIHMTPPKFDNGLFEFIRRDTSTHQTWDDRIITYALNVPNI